MPAAREPNHPRCSPRCIEFVCDGCGETCHATRVNLDGGWYVRHGPNPEHRSPLYPGDTLFVSGSVEWVTAVHARMQR